MSETIEVKWLTRPESGLPPANLGALTKRPVRILGATVHHTATADNDPNPIGTWRRICLEATSAELPSKERYADTPYNAGAAKLRNGVGAILAGRPNGYIGAHTLPPADMTEAFVHFPNLYTLGIALVGTNPTPESIAALKAYLWVCNLGLDAPLVFPHGPFWDPTDCPSNEVRTMLVDLHSPFVHIAR